VPALFGLQTANRERRQEHVAFLNRDYAGGLRLNFPVVLGFAERLNPQCLGWRAIGPMHLHLFKSGVVGLGGQSQG